MCVTTGWTCAVGGTYSVANLPLVVPGLFSLVTYHLSGPSVVLLVPRWFFEGCLFGSHCVAYADVITSGAQLSLVTLSAEYLE